MIKDFHRIVINLNQNEINDLLDYFNEARKETLKEVEKKVNECEINIWKDKRRFEGIKCKTCLPLDYMSEYFDKLKEDLKK